MTAVNLVIAVEAVQNLFMRYADGQLMDLHVPSLVAAGIAVGKWLLSKRIVNLIELSGQGCLVSVLLLVTVRVVSSRDAMGRPQE